MFRDLNRTTVNENEIGTAVKKEELLSRIELPTSSLPRKCSTAELQQLRI